MSTSSVIHADKYYVHLWQNFSQAIEATGHNRYRYLSMLSVFYLIAFTEDINRLLKNESKSFIYGLNSIIYCFLGKWDLAEKFQQKSLAIDPNDFLLKITTAFIAFHDWEIFYESKSSNEKYSDALYASLAAIDAFPPNDSSQTVQDFRIFSFLILCLLSIPMEMGIRHQRIHDILLNCSFGNDVNKIDQVNIDVESIKKHAKEAISLLL